MPPAAEPVSLAELKSQLRIDDSGEDALLSSLITVAVATIENRLGIHLITRTSRVWFDASPQRRQDDYWPASNPSSPESWRQPRQLMLPCRPWTSIASMTAYDDSDAATVVPAAQYFLTVAGIAQRNRLAIRNDATWPATTRTAQALAIQGSTGFGSAGTDVPAPLRQAVLMLASYLYEHRGDCADAGTACGACGADLLMFPFRLMEI